MALEWLLSIVAPPLCWSCGRLAPAGAPLCARCRLRLRWLGPEAVTVAGVPAWAPVAYEGPARALVQALKFRGAAGVAEPMAAQMAAGAPTRLLERAVLVPVPLHPVRLRQRGFNQAERLAASVARRTGLPCMPCLERRGGGAPQVGRHRVARLTAVRDSIHVGRDLDAPHRALLVDDVITTGGTLSACASALRAGGTRDVAALAYARTLGR
ncbi:MAG TPA: hypothetical protein VKB17_00510 [Thermoleophilaceae bacterium]|nr:hypothetical protein [Thermoleophilaceae bacterium]